MMSDVKKYDDLLFGASPDEGLLAFELEEADKNKSFINIYRRENEGTRSHKEPFVPWIVATAGLATGCPADHDLKPLKGSGDLNELIIFKN